MSGHKNRIDLTNQRFGRLVVVSYWKSIKSKPAYLCKCDCGAEKYVSANALRQGYTRSCGCLNLESLARNRLKITSREKKLTP